MQESIEWRAPVVVFKCYDKNLKNIKAFCTSVMSIVSRLPVEPQYVCQVFVASSPCVLTLPEDDSSFGSDHQTGLAG